MSLADAGEGRDGVTGEVGRNAKPMGTTHAPIRHDLISEIVHTGGYNPSIIRKQFSYEANRARLKRPLILRTTLPCFPTQLHIAVISRRLFFTSRVSRAVLLPRRRGDGLASTGRFQSSDHARKFGLAVDAELGEDVLQVGTRGLIGDSEVACRDFQSLPGREPDRQLGFLVGQSIENAQEIALDAPSPIPGR